jgi:TetR/AcrR family transcriptional repressor of bet genes
LLTRRSVLISRQQTDVESAPESYNPKGYPCIKRDSMTEPSDLPADLLTAEPTGQRPRASRARQRQHLIDACISALHVHGPSNTTVEKVVAIAGMSPGIVRFYFASKAAMLVASLEYLSREFEEQLLLPVAALKDTPVLALTRLVELYLGPELASTRKVSVWYSFWGEASSRQEYYDICGKRDARFEALVDALIKALIADTRSAQLDADGIALGLIGVLEILWQGYAFQSEQAIDRAAAKRRCMAYLNSVFPGQFGLSARSQVTHSALPASAYSNAALFALERSELYAHASHCVGLHSDIPTPGDYLTLDAPLIRALVLRDTNGMLKAYANHCAVRPHALVMAPRGRLTDHTLLCPSHGHVHALNTDPSLPNVTALQPLTLSVVGGLLFVCNSEGAPPLAGAALAASTREWTALPSMPDVDLAADWKILVEGWLASAAWSADLKSAMAAMTVSTVLDSTRSRLECNSFSAKRRQSLVKHLEPTETYCSFIAPNQLIELLPAGLNITQLLPVGPGRCRVRTRLYGPATPTRYERAVAYLNRRLHKQQLAQVEALAESIQQGLEAGLGADSYPRWSAPLTAFHHMINTLITGSRRPFGETP